MYDDKLREEFPGNSYTKARKEKPADIQETKSAPEKKGRVRMKQKTLGERIAESFLAADIDEIRERTVFDWLIPGIKNLIEDIVHTILFGDSGRGVRRSRRDRDDGKMRRVPYDAMYDDPRRSTDSYISQRGSRKPELIFDYESQAQQVKSGMQEYIDDYGKISLKQFYNIVSEVTRGDIDIPTSYTQTRYGWYDITGARVIHVRDGWYLDIPRAEVIER